MPPAGHSVKYKNGQVPQVRHYIFPGTFFFWGYQRNYFSSFHWSCHPVRILSWGLWGLPYQLCGESPPWKMREIELPDDIVWIAEAKWIPRTGQLCESINPFVFKLVQLGFVYGSDQPPPPLPSPANFPKLTAINSWWVSVYLQSFWKKLHTPLYGALRCHTLPITSRAWFLHDLWLNLPTCPHEECAIDITPRDF